MDKSDAKDSSNDARSSIALYSWFPERRPESVSSSPHLQCSSCAVCQATDIKVMQDQVIVDNQHIAWLDIPVEHPGHVQACDCLQVKHN